MSHFLHREVFTAKGLMTKPESKRGKLEGGKFSYRVEVGQEYAQEYHINVRFLPPPQEDIDNLVVYGGNEIIGFCPTERVKGDKLMKDDIVGPDYISENAPLHEVASKLSEMINKTKATYYLLFVKDNEGKVIGLLNQADLNRWSCYLYSYLIVLYVEKKAADLVRKQWDYVCPRLNDPKITWSKYLKKILDNQKSPSREEVIRECDIRDLERMVEMIQGPCKENVLLDLREISKKIGDKDGKNLRNRIAHTVNRIVERSYTAGELKIMGGIWERFWVRLMNIKENYLNTSGHSLLCD